MVKLGLGAAGSAHVQPQPRFDHKAQRPPRSIQARVSIGSRCTLVHHGRLGVGGMPGNPQRCSLTLSSLWAGAEVRLRAASWRADAVLPQPHKAQRPPRSIQARVSIGSRCTLVHHGRLGVGGMPGNPQRCSLTLSSLWAGAEVRLRAATAPFSPQGSEAP